jgi:hypothetical protein
MRGFKSALGSLARRALSGREAAGIFLFGFFFLLFFRTQALFYPPYWDSILGLFTEAIWLSENRFDYVALASWVSGYESGGARIYLFSSFYPALQALFLTFVKNRQAFFFLNHLAGIALASGVAAVFFRVARDLLGLRHALLACALLFFCPLFISQAYAINMEMPAMIFIVSGSFFFMRGRHAAALGLFLGSLFFKYYAVIFSFAAGVSLLWLRPLGPGRGKKDLGAALAYGLPCLLHACGRVLARALSAMPPEESDLEFSLLPEFDKFLRKFVVLARSPDLTLLILLGLLGGLFFLMESRRARKSPGDLLLCMGSLSLLALWSAIYFFSRFLPRYCLVFLPYAILLMLHEVRGFRLRGRSMAGALAVFFLAFYAFNMKGGLYQKVEFPFDMNQNGGAFFERTLAYEDDMEANLQLMGLLETKYKDRTVLTTWPVSHMLVSEKFGYVGRPRRVVSVARRCFDWKGTPFLFQADWSDPKARGAVGVFSESGFSHYFKKGFASGKLCDVVRRGRKSIYLFRGPASREGARR